jgi:uncharacterized membrane protein/nitrite reductase/ring-hydroxylating ferredoxin subunit
VLLQNKSFVYQYCPPFTENKIHMKSRASFKSHPLHPILVSFPIAFFTGTLVFDTLAILFNRDHLAFVGYFMEIAGIFGGLLAAIPGIIDYSQTVPPHSSAKSRAAKHGLTNTFVLLVFTGAWFYRRQEFFEPWLLIAIESAGFILMMIAGWMGGTLVYRNQIGVDPRYAHAGKWKEVYLPELQPGSDIEVGTTDDLKINQMKLLHVGKKRIVLSRTEKGYAAFDDRCTHKGGSLAGGSMICGTVQCPWHGSQFDVYTGQLKAGPGKDPIHCYIVKEDNGKVFLRL